MNESMSWKTAAKKKRESIQRNSFKANQKRQTALQNRRGNWKKNMNRGENVWDFAYKECKPDS